VPAATGIDSLREWITLKFNDYVIDGTPVNGTYGLIWFIKAKESNVHPQARALKTLNPDDLTDLSNLQDVVYLEREFRMWMELKPTYNVINPTNLYFAHLPTIRATSNKILKLPVMMMARMKGDLRSWVGNEKFGIIDRLLALAQAFNGLLCLYSNGIEGHGDLKPENFLYCNLDDNLHLDNDSWLYDHPWLIKVADFGWADAWIDYGYTTKAFRHYMAPERFEREGGKFIPEKSDMFAMGIIAAELLQDKHPATNLKKAKKSEGRWLKWVEKHEPDLHAINSERMKNLIKDCLHPDYNQRPTAKKCLDKICCELREEHNLDVAPTLQEWRRDLSETSSVSKYEQAADLARRSIGFGGIQEQYSREKLENLIEEIDVCGIKSCRDWTTIASALIYVYEHEGDEGSILKIKQLRLSGFRHLDSNFNDLESAQLNALSLPGSEVIMQFERLTQIIHDLVDIANITYKDAITRKVSLSHLAFAAFAFSEAGKSKMNDPEDSIIQYYLEETIRLAPEEATPFFFRALWAYQQSFFREKNTISSRIIQDLKTACELAQTWEEPRDLLNKLCDKTGKENSTS
jgi:serine/threonine protein kinase